MPRITTQKEFKANRKVNFCYLCGKPLDNCKPTDDDHCPPKSIFSKQDRANYPIVLKVHRKCNHEKHLDDEMLSLFFDPLSKQGKARKDKHRNKMEKRKVSVNFQNHQLYGYTDLPLRPFASRVAQCMHAILYKECFPNGVIEGGITYPFTEVSQSGELLSKKSFEDSLFIARKIAGSIKADTFDCIIAYNKKFKYVCCWADHVERPVCLYAFDIMNMAHMASSVTGLPKAVIGHYFMNPPTSEYSKVANIEIPLSAADVEYPLPTKC